MARKYVLALLLTLLVALIQPLVAVGNSQDLSEKQGLRTYHDPREYLKTLVTEKELSIISRIIACESSWDPQAYNNKSGDTGLMQIHVKDHLETAKEIDRKSVV